MGYYSNPLHKFILVYMCILWMDLAELETSGQCKIWQSGNIYHLMIVYFLYVNNFSELNTNCFQQVGLNTDVYFFCFLKFTKMQIKNF